MPCNQRDDGKVYLYVTDRDENMLVLLTESVAAAGNFTLYTNQTNSGFKPKKLRMRNFKWKNLTTGQRQTIPANNFANTSYISGGEYTLAGSADVWKVTGRRGESGKVGRKNPPAP